MISVVPAMRDSVVPSSGKSDPSLWIKHQARKTLHCKILNKTKNERTTSTGSPTHAGKDRAHQALKSSGARQTQAYQSRSILNKAAATIKIHRPTGALDPLPHMLRALRPARKVSEDIRHGIRDQLDKPDHRNPQVVLPNQVRRPPEHDQHRPNKPVARDWADHRAESVQAPDIGSEQGDRENQ